MKKNRLQIVFRNGTVTTYDPEEYTEYEYRENVFVVIKKSKWVCIANMNTVMYITIE